VAGKPIMQASLQRAFGYQGDKMHLPVRHLAAALPFYETVLGFRVVSRGDAPYNAAVLERDGVQIGLEENGGDPSQDGCAFHVHALESLFAEFTARGLKRELPAFDVEEHDGVSWNVFYLIAPDGLCYWFGERQSPELS
jgi:catechol 2,3-dioxygenase-like lactoylglutathione lyase family enzyme